MKFKSARVVAVGVLVVVGAGLAEVAIAQTDAVAIVKARQDLMGSLFPHLRPIRDVVQGRSTDLDGAAASARRFADATKQIVARFPPGTGREAAPDTRAKPEIWSKRAEFEATANLLVVEAEKLAAAAATKNVEAIRPQFATVVQACGGCHGGPADSGGTYRFEK
jgi:cytochrome c556